MEEDKLLFYFSIKMIKCFQALLVLLTSILLLIGVFLLVSISYLKLSYNVTVTTSGGLDAVVIVVSALHVIVTVLGYYGIIRKSVKALIVYIVSVASFAPVKIAFVVIALMGKYDTKRHINSYMSSSNDQGRKYFQNYFSCCRIDNNMSKLYPSDDHSSCFKDGSSTVRKPVCVEMFSKFMNENKPVIGCVSGGIAFIELLIVVFSSVLVCDEKYKCFPNKTRVTPITRSHIELVEERNRRKSRKLSDYVQHDLFDNNDSLPNEKTQVSSGIYQNRRFRGAKMKITVQPCIEEEDE